MYDLSHKYICRGGEYRVVLQVCSGVRLINVVCLENDLFATGQRN